MSSALVEQFRSFYGEVIRLKRAVVHRGASALGSSSSVDGDATVETLEPVEAEGSDRVGADEIDQVWRRLSYLLDQQSFAPGRFGESHLPEANDLQYLMAAVADETFLHLPWAGRDWWRSNLLESRLFDTHSAGEVVFRKIDTLLATRDPVFRDMARVYLMALALGFQGRFRSAEGQVHLAAYRRHLYAFVHGREPDLAAPGRRIFEQAYAHNLEHGGGARLPPLRRWVGILGVAAALMFLISHLAWRDVVGDLPSILRTIVGAG